MSNAGSSAKLESPQGDSSSQDDTLSRIATIANDVEMHDEQSPRGSPMGYLVLDTNVLINDLDVLRDFSEDVDNAPSLPISMKIIVPNAVLNELDGLKKREGLSWFARTASTFLLGKIQEKKSWKVQARSETTGQRPQAYEQERSQDIMIFNCCCFFRTKGIVVLLTNDVNLRTLCENEEPQIHTIAPGKRHLSSRELAKQLFGESDGLKHFRGKWERPKYAPTRTPKARHLARTEAPGADDDEDRMDIDVASPFDDYIPSHALDALHRQVIDHFTVVLKDLARRVRERSGDAGPSTCSRYAPAYRRKDVNSWTIDECLEYLGAKKRIKSSQPALRTFLLRRNEKPGWRRGQDWSRQAWINAIQVLEDIGNVYEDNLMSISVKELWPHVREVFSAPLRPTGI